jgi:hypothetical protein
MIHNLQEAAEKVSLPAIGASHGEAAPRGLGKRNWLCHG